MALFETQEQPLTLTIFSGPQRAGACEPKQWTVAEDAQDPKVRSMMLRIAAANADDRAAQDSIMFRVVRPDNKRSTDAAIGFLDRPQECEALGGGRGKIA
jgi:hypothetical protein